jgi:hypothetical protein
MVLWPKSFFGHNRPFFGFLGLKKAQGDFWGRYLGQKNRVIRFFWPD